MNQAEIQEHIEDQFHKGKYDPQETDAQRVFRDWQELTNVPLREYAEKNDGCEVYSDGLHYVIEMPDESCIVDTACSEYTCPDLHSFFERIESFPEDSEI